MQGHGLNQLWPRYMGWHNCELKCTLHAARRDRTFMRLSARAAAGQGSVAMGIPIRTALQLPCVMQGIAAQSWAVDSGGHRGRQQRRPAIGGETGRIVSVPREQDEGRADGA
jgi:hypothetical protein